MPTADPTHCAYHRRRPRVAICGTCGKGICMDCIVRTGVGIKCRDCTGVKAAAAPKAGRIEVDDAPQAPANRSRSKPWAVPVAVGGVVVLAAAAFGPATRESQPTVTEEVTSAGSAAGFTERQTEFVGAGGHEHSSSAAAPTIQRDADARAALTGWVKVQLTS